MLNMPLEGQRSTAGQSIFLSSSRTFFFGRLLFDVFCDDAARVGHHLGFARLLTGHVSICGASLPSLRHFGSPPLALALIRRQLSLPFKLRVASGLEALAREPCVGFFKFRPVARREVEVLRTGAIVDLSGATDVGLSAVVLQTGQYLTTANAVANDTLGEDLCFAIRGYTTTQGNQINQIQGDYHPVRCEHLFEPCERFGLEGRAQRRPAHGVRAIFVKVKVLRAEALERPARL